MPDSDLIRNLRDLPPEPEPQPFELLLAELVKINAGISDLKERLNVGNELRIEQNEALTELMNANRIAYNPARPIRKIEPRLERWS